MPYSRINKNMNYLFFTLSSPEYSLLHYLDFFLKKWITPIKVHCYVEGKSDKIFVETKFHTLFSAKVSASLEHFRNKMELYFCL